MSDKKLKTPTYSGHKLQDRIRFQGMDISIENKAGSKRSWTDPKGESGETNMKFDYGYIRGTVGRDKDHIDCYIGPNLESSQVFVVHQYRPDTKVHDEDKVMLGFDSKEHAKKAYLQHIPAEWYGSMDALDIVEFKEKVMNKKVNMIKSLIEELDKYIEMEQEIEELAGELVKGGIGSGKRGHVTDQQLKEDYQKWLAGYRKNIKEAEKQEAKKPVNMSKYKDMSVDELKSEMMAEADKTDIDHSAKHKISEIYKLIKEKNKVQKGGAGSGSKGHKTDKPQNEKPKVEGEQAEEPKPSIGQTSSGKPIPSDVNDIDESWEAQDHQDAMNFHYDVVNKVSEKIQQHKAMNPGFKTPKQVTEMIDHHLNMTKKHQSMFSRKLNIKKSLMKGGKGSGKRGHKTYKDEALSPLKQRMKQEFDKYPGLDSSILKIPDKILTTSLKGQEQQWSGHPGKVPERLKDLFYTVLDEDTSKKDIDNNINTVNNHLKDAGYKPNASFDGSGSIEFKLESIKKSMMPMDPTGLGIETSDYAKELEQVEHGMWFRIFNDAVKDLDYGSEPAQVILDSGNIAYISKIEDGVYSAIVQKDVIDLADGLPETIMRTERQTIPSMILHMTAKGVIGAEGEPIIEMEPVEIPVASELAQPLSDGPFDGYDYLEVQNATLQNKIRMLELLLKLIS